MAVYSFGFGKMGSLGLGNFDDALEPSILESLKGKKIIQVACGEQHSLAVAELGDLYVWGRGKEGQTGQGDRNNTAVPMVVKALRHERIIQADCGNNHCVALADTGRVYIWGRLYNRNATTNKQYFGLAVEMPGMKTQQILDRSFAQYFSGAKDKLSEEEVSSLNNSFGNFIPYLQSIPIMVSGPLAGKKVVNVAAGYAFTVVVTDAGEVYSWGFNEKGQLGLGDRFNHEDPTLIHALNGIHVIKASCGQQHTAVLTKEGEIYTFGLGVFGQLGHGVLRDELLPRRVESLIESGQKVAQIALGSYYTMARTESGQIFSWGHGEYGQHDGTQNFQDWGAGEYGDSKEKNHYHSIPRPLQGLSNNGKDNVIVDHLAGGHLHSIAVTNKNEIYTWGWGSSGCLGHGDRRFQLIPKQITQLQGEAITSVAAGNKHTLIVTSSSISTFAFDFAPLVDNKLYSDLRFEIEGKVIHAHKVVVLSRCEHIKKMILFQNRFGAGIQFPSSTEGTSTASSDYLKIRGVRYPIFLALVRYLYTDHLKIAPHLRKDLGALAAKYGLPRLEAICKRAASFTVDEEDAQQMVIPQSTFALEMRNAINNPSSGTDITFILKGSNVGEKNVKIRAHRAILKMRCPYFETLFMSDFKEKDQSDFVLDDEIDPTIFTSLLSYIYSNDESIINEEDAVDLLRYADRFMIDDMKQLVEHYIEQSIEVENAAWLLEISDRFGAHRLKRVCLELICETDKETWEMIRRSKGFADIRYSSPHLVREIDYRISKHHLSKPGEAIRSLA